MSDWINRVVLPDVYPRRDDPFRPPGGSVPPTAPAGSMLEPEVDISADVFADWITDPAQRPVVYQRGLNFTVTANTTPVALTNGDFQCDSIVLDVYSTAANSVFVGYGSGVTVLSGMEIRAGLPVTLTPENSREQWELQRILEAIGAMIAAERGYGSPGKFRSPRVVFNARDFWLVAAVATNVSVMLFTVPELQ